ncbi:hypothetical protein ABZ442_05855 [Streptomyces triculaminicus]|uniref:hypothetical protein n=1 Tax=Streptomyces triculaminicus TaxID=2816232 RepID=UPI00340B8EC6
MTDPLYTPESEADTRLEHLGYNASVHDLVVQAAHKELNRFLQNEGEAVQMWGWDPNSLHAADRYRIAQLLRSFIYQEQRIVAALKWLDGQYRAYVDSSPQNRQKAEAFIDSLNQAAARRAVDLVAGHNPWHAAAEWLTDDKRDAMAKEVVAKWQQEAPHTDAHASTGERGQGPGFMYKRVNEGEQLVGRVIATHLKGTPGFSKVTETLGEDDGGSDSGSVASLAPELVEHLKKTIPGFKPVADAAKQVVDAVDDLVDRVYSTYVDPFGGDYLPPAFRRVHALRSIVDFHDPQIARDLGRRGDLFSSLPWDEQGNKRPEDTTFKGSGFDMDLWRLKDVGYAKERIPDGQLYDLVDTALAVQAEYQLQCFFVDRELSKVIDTRGKEEQWLYEKTAAWAAERARAEAEAKAKASGFWGFVGDILGLVSAAAGILALIPVLTPIMAPIAIVSAVGSMGAHAAAASISGNWDAGTIITLGADALAVIPAIGAVAKGAKGAWAAARMNKVANVIISDGGRAFLGAVGIGRAGKGASDAAGVFNYLGKKGAEVVTGTAVQSKIPGKVLQGAVSLTTQVPTVVDWATGTVGQSAKDAAAGTALTANFGQTVGSWDAVGNVAKSAGKISIERFSNFFKAVKL